MEKTTLLCTTAAEGVKTTLPEGFAISACFSLRLGGMHNFCVFFLFFSVCSVPLLAIISSTWGTFPISSVFALSFSCNGHHFLRLGTGPWEHPEACWDRGSISGPFCPCLRFPSVAKTTSDVISYQPPPFVF